MSGVFARPLFLFRLLLITLVAVAVLGPVGAASAAAAPPFLSPTTASGTWTTTSVTFNSSRQVGAGITINEITDHVSYTGTFSGTSVLHGILIFFPDGSAFFHDTETFTGTVEGKSGTVTFDLIGGSGPAGDYHGTQTIVRGTGDLANLHGVLHQVGTVAAGPAGTYTGQIF
jgi:hypothetical protein